MVKYFVAYNCATSIGSFFGSSEVIIDCKIRGFQDIQSVREMIEKELKVEKGSVAILNYIKLP